MSANQSISDREDSFPHRRLSQLVEKLLHQSCLIIVEIRQPRILLLQPFKLLIIHQCISLYSLYLLLGILPIQRFNLADNLHESAGDRPVLLLNPFVNTEYRRFTSDSRRFEVYLTVAERLCNPSNTLYIPCHSVQLLLFRLKFNGLVVQLRLVLGNKFQKIGFLGVVFVECYSSGRQFLFNIIEQRFI